MDSAYFEMHSGVVKKSILVGCDTTSLEKWFPVFLIIVVPSSERRNYNPMEHQEPLAH
jgi:hypothetical protein